MAESSIGIWPGAPVPPTAENPTPGVRIVLVGHAGDPRLWQCRLPDRDDCGDIFVVDRIAWLEGVDAPLQAHFFGEIQTTLTVDEAISATGVDSDRVLNVIAVRAESAGAIDPRFSGIDAKILWVVRVAGTVDEFGTADATNFVVDDSNSNVVLALPLAVPDDYAPALLTVQVDDQRTPSGGDWGYTNYSILNAEQRSIQSQEAGVVLEPGTYTLRGNITGDITAPPPGPPCVTDIDLVANQDLWMKVTFAQDGSCDWAGTEPLP